MPNQHFNLWMAYYTVKEDREREVQKKHNKKNAKGTKRSGGF